MTRPSATPTPITTRPCGLSVRCICVIAAARWAGHEHEALWHSPASKESSRNGRLAALPTCQSMVGSAAPAWRARSQSSRGRYRWRSYDFGSQTGDNRHATSSTRPLGRKRAGSSRRAESSVAMARHEVALLGLGSAAGEIGVGAQLRVLSLNARIDPQWS